MSLLAVYKALYTASVVGTGALCVLSQIPPPARSSGNYRMTVMLMSTLVTEFPQIFLLLKFLILYSASSAGVFATVSTFTSWLYRFDIAVFLCVWALFLQCYFARFIVEEQTKMYRAVDSHDPPGFFHLGYWFRLLNPFWSARNVMIHPDICYATDAELKSAGPAAEPYMSLDIHIHPSYPRNRPVLLYIHGGAWSLGDKTVTPPFISYMALKKWVVVSINHRLSPNVQYPTHLIDAKRALRWTRQHIARYGGDPSFIAVAGTSAGGHTASMLALTQNDPFFQPGFESFDTTVQACVGMNAILDVSNHKRYWRHRFQDWFAVQVAGLEGGFAPNEETMMQASPVIILKRIEAERRKSTAAAVPSGAAVNDAPAVVVVPHVGAAPHVELALSESTTNAKSTPETSVSEPRAVTGLEELPPFLLFHGRADILVPFRSARDFVQSFKKISKSAICYIEFPNANHMYDILSAPRGHYIAYAIDRFLGSMWEKHQGQVAAVAATTASLEKD